MLDDVELVFMATYSLKEVVTVFLMRTDTRMPLLSQIWREVGLGQPRKSPQGGAIATQFNDLGFCVSPDFAPCLFWEPIQIQKFATG